MRTAYIKYIGSLLLFGSNGIVASFIDLSSIEIVFLRALIGSFLLYVIFRATKQTFIFKKHKKSFLFLAISGLAMGASWMFLYEAYQQIGVGIASLAYYCGPLIVIVLSPIVFKERLTLPKILGVFVVVLGIFCVNGTLIQSLDNAWGLYCGAMSALMFAIMMICSKKAAPISGIENSMFQLFFSLLVVVGFVAWKQHFIIQITRENIIPILILGVVNTAIGCYLYFSPITKLPIQSVSVLGYLEPLSAVIFSAIILRESMVGIQILGAVLILGGAAYTECSGLLRHLFKKDVHNKLA